jgi:phage-related protein
MPQTKLVFYREADGTVPVLEWLDGLPRPAIVKCRVKLDRLKELGHELRRPEADFLRDGIYELRIRLQRINYRVLYFFHGNTAAVVSHGILKERAVPPKEIDRALKRKEEFAKDPKMHAHEET